MQGTMEQQDLATAEWRKSSFSGAAQNCVEVARNVPGIVAVRDSKNPHSPALVISRACWAAFTELVKAG
ncbi:MAG: DUF397 domain-containing protein [Mycobacterium sp.]